MSNLLTNTTMKRNTFFLVAGILAVIEVIVLWLSIEMNNPLPIQISILLGILVVYLARRSVTEVIQDERTTLISQKAAMHTLEIFWVIFTLVSISSVIYAFNRPFPIRPHFPPPPAELPIGGVFGFFGFFQLALLCLMIFLYVGFRMYYARKYGEFDTDEE
ncbi:MAG: DUF2178 domain-containing protein [Methanomicrobiales archaeon]|nr:DUF2178 domain-containing protein [Methanomicrobiales archaeon]